MEEKSLYQAHAARTGAMDSVLATNKVLKNTYMLLSMTLLFSAATAGISMAIGLPHGAALLLSLVGLGLLFVVNATANSGKGIFAVFAFTGVMGAALGPMLSYYLSLPNGPGLVMQALGGTALVFFGLSGYALTTRKDFSYMGGFLIVGLLVAIVAGLILFDTSRIINGGETNYIRATVALYLDIYNLFVNLLHLLGAFGGDE